MNLFRTSADAVESAHVLADQHVIKMAVEASQILASAARMNGLMHPDLYKATHKKHPCVLWAAGSQEAAASTMAHGLALCQEYQNRFGKPHKSLKQLLLIQQLGFDSFPTNPAGEGPKCVPKELSKLPLHQAYRETLLQKYAEWKKPPRWTNTLPPAWIMD